MPITLESIAEQCSASVYLSKLSEQTDVKPNLEPQALDEELSRLCTELETYEFESLEDAQKQLLQSKINFNYVWSLAEVSQLLTQPNLGRWQTRFAEVSIDFALRFAWLTIAPKHKAIQGPVEQAKGKVEGLFIFGMGKLGGYDLNFSSDVDLVAYFDPSILPVPDMLGKSYVCHQVLQLLTKLLGQGGQSNFVWRVDWRLRPNASATSLAMSVEIAEDYYFYRASPWHRLALMKARVVAGDITLGQRFLNTLTPFIWRQNLDYRALDELAEIKQKINLEHPSLRVQRRWSEPIAEDIEGFDVKLGSGGIREVEFVANALQLLWGGRHSALRTPNTIEALHALHDRNKIKRSIAIQLTQAYEYLRRIENAIQMMGNQQTHLIPTSPQNKQTLLILLGIDHWSELIRGLNIARKFVHQTFSELFAEQTQAQGEAVSWPSELSPQAEDIVESWEAGFLDYGVSNQVRHRLKPLTHGIANYLSEHDEDASETIVRLHEFFRALPSGEQYFRLLAESPSLLQSMVPPLLHSPPMTLLLKQSPHIIDCYLSQQWQYPERFDSAHVKQADNYGERLERLRRFVNEHLYQLYLNFLQGILDVPTFQSALTELAEHTLELALDLVREHMQLESVPITVIGMGKVALRRMSPLSDLDLIFVFDQDKVGLELASRFVSRLQTAIATPMREGIVYELDTRLRPSGRSGAPTVSIESFANHHRQRAHTWEHIALMSSRVVAGDKSNTNRLDGIKRELLTTPRDQDQLIKDAQKMWYRIAEHRVKPIDLTLMFNKLRVGGLMQAEYLAACVILRDGLTHDQASVEFDDLLANSTEATGLINAMEFWRTQQLWERLLGKSEKNLSSLPDDYLAVVLSQSNAQSLDQLLGMKKQHVDFVSNAMDAFFDGLKMSVSETQEWLETQVHWL